MHGFAEKIDPLASLVLSLAIVGTWIALAREYLAPLAQTSVDADILEGLQSEVQRIIREHGTKDIVAEHVVAYRYSFSAYMVEVDLAVYDTAGVPFSKVATVIAALENKIPRMP